MSAFFNIGSLILGLAAWALPLIALTRRRSAAGISFALCAASVLLQLREVKNRVRLQDFAAIEDTISAVAFAATVLLIGTVVLNICVYVINQYRCK